MRYAPIVCVCLGVFRLAAADKPNREVQELQRDVAQLQEAIQELQRGLDARFTALSAQIQVIADSSAKAAAATAGIQRSVEDQQASIAPLIAAQGSRIDQAASNLSTMQQSLADLTAVINRMQTQVTDLGNAVKVMQAPVAPPPPTGPGGPQAGIGAPPMSGTELYNNALRDRSGGKIDLALQEFNDYLKWYGNTDLAPNAQFYVADIHFSQGDYDSALREFDMVLEKYPDGNKTPDALYMKGRTLVQLGRRTQGAEEFRELIKRYPNSDLAKKACSQLNAMGLKCGSAPRAAASKKNNLRRRK